MSCNPTSCLEAQLKLLHDHRRRPQGQKGEGMAQHGSKCVAQKLREMQGNCDFNTKKKSHFTVGSWCRLHSTAVFCARRTLLAAGCFLALRCIFEPTRRPTRTCTPRQADRGDKKDLQRDTHTHTRTHTHCDSST